jgi:hypothetical protein
MINQQSKTMEENMNDILTEQAAKLVETEILADQTSLVCECLAQGIFDQEDIENEFQYIDKHGVIIQGKELSKAKKKDNFFEIYEWEPKAIDNWWLVGEMLAECLESNNEPMLQNKYGIWWGRTTVGQPIRFDHVIQKIAQEIYENPRIGK